MHRTRLGRLTAAAAFVTALVVGQASPAFAVGASEISGTIYDSAGSPVPEGLVVVKSNSTFDSYQAAVQSDGSFHVTGIASGSYKLRVQFASGGDPAEVWSWSDWTSPDDSLVLDGDSVTGYDITVYRANAAPTIDGRVLRSAGDLPISDATVTLYRWDADYLAPVGPPITTTTTDAQGRYRFTGLDADAEYTMTFEASGYAFQTYRDGGLVDPALYVSFWSYYDPGYRAYHRIASIVRMDASAIVTGSLTTPDTLAQAEFADGAASAEVQVRDPESGRWFWTGYGVPADADGSYRLDLPAGQYRIQASYLGSRGEAVVVSTVRSLASGQSSTFNAELRPYLRDVDGDFAGDVLGRGATGNVLMYSGTGDGALGASSLVATGWTSYNALLQAGDTNSDGHADILARDTTGAMWLYLGTGGEGTSTFAPRTQIATGWKSYLDVLSPGDVNGDGHPDVLTRDSAGKLWMFPGDGTGHLGGRVQVGSGWTGATAFVTPGDFDSDGYPDLVVRDRSGYLWLYRGIAAGTFSTTRTKLGSGWQNATAIFSVGDFDGDWTPDLLGRGATGNLYYYAGSGAGNLGAPVKLNSGWQKATFVL